MIWRVTCALSRAAIRILLPPRRQASRRECLRLKALRFTRGPFRAARPPVASHKSALLPEPILTVHEYLMKAGQDNPDGLVSETTCSSRQVKSRGVVFGG
jgi:hypothetical protein